MISFPSSMMRGPGPASGRIRRLPQLEIDILGKQRAVGIGKVCHFPIGHFKGQSGVLYILRQIGGTHNSTPVRLAISIIGISLVRASFRTISNLRSPNARVKAP